MGGPSPEHQISIISARNIISALDPALYDLTVFGIDLEGNWTVEPLTSLNPYEFSKDLKFVSLEDKEKVLITPGSSSRFSTETKTFSKFDVIFPALHGPYGEDGKLQGLLEVLNIAYIGSGVYGSALAMDKVIAKTHFQKAKIPTAKFITFNMHDKHKPSYDDVCKELGNTFYIKPSCLGSSIGINKVSNKQMFENAVNAAFKFDSKLIIEEEIKGREIEIALLGNNNPKASLPGEVRVKSNFYSYEAKYKNKDDAQLLIPTSLSDKEYNELKHLAIKAFGALSCKGMARVDFFLTKEGWMINEINTIPGFTDISMFPSLWCATGLSYSKLIDELVKLAREDHNQKKQLETTNQ